MKEKLTAKQEKFIQNIIKGMSQTDAYREAFDITTAKPESVYTMSSSSLSIAF